MKALRSGSVLTNGQSTLHLKTVRSFDNSKVDTKTTGHYSKPRLVMSRYTDSRYPDRSVRDTDTVPT